MSGLWVDLFLEGHLPGKELIESILNIRPETKIIVSTAMFLSREEKNNLIEKGIRTILDKPYDILHLCNIVTGKVAI